MARTQPKTTMIPGTPGGPAFAARIRNTSAKEFHDTYGRTAAVYFSQERAIPSVETGLKPVQRRLLYAAFREKITPDAKPRKSSFIVSATTGRYHPHGDGAVYQAMTTITRPYSRLRLFQGFGNFGNKPGDEPAAPRYTEAKLSKAGWEMVRDLQDNVVPMKPNYDHTDQEPLTLPVRFPAGMVFGAMGMATGFSTKIPAHNVRELLTVCKALLTRPDLSVDEMMALMPGPDWGVGGEVIGSQQEIREYYETGCGTLTVRSKLVATKPGKGRKDQVVLVEPIPGLNVESHVNVIKEKVRSGALPGIRGVENHTDLEHGLHVTFFLRRGVTQDEAIEQLLAYTDLEATYRVQMVMLDRQRRPRTWSMAEALLEFLALRDEVVLARATHHHAAVAAKLLKARALAVVALNKQQVVDTIMNAEDADHAVRALMAALPLDEEQARYILSVALRKLTKADALEAQAEVEELERQRDYYQQLMDSADARKQVIADELDEQLALFAGPEHDRRTVLLHDETPAQRATETISDEERLSLWKLDVTSGLLGDDGASIAKGHVVWAVFSDGRVKLLHGKGLPNRIVEKPVAPDITELVACGTCDPASDSLVLVASSGKALRVACDAINPQGIAGNGVAGIKLGDGEFVVAGAVARDHEVLGTTSEQGWKVTKIADIPIKGRGTQGVMVHKLRKAESQVTSGIVAAALRAGDGPAKPTSRTAATHRGAVLLSVAP